MTSGGRFMKVERVYAAPSDWPLPTRLLLPKSRWKMWLGT